MMPGPSQSQTSAWNRQSREQNVQDPLINIYTVSSNGVEFNHLTLVCSRVPHSKIRRLLPALQSYVDAETSSIILPGTQSAVEDDTLHDLIQAVLQQDSNGDITFNVPEDPISYIQTHVVLVLLGRCNEATIVEERLWTLLGQAKLTLLMVSWIWETFGAPSKEQERAYEPPFSDLYVQAVAWQLLNLKNAGSLGSDVEEYIFDSATPAQEALLKILIEREQKYGFESGYGSASSTPRPESRKAPVNPNLASAVETSALPAARMASPLTTISRASRASPAPMTSPIQPTLPALNLSRAGLGLSSKSFFGKDVDNKPQLPALDTPVETMDTSAPRSAHTADPSNVPPEPDAAYGTAQGGYNKGARGNFDHSMEAVPTTSTHSVTNTTTPKPAGFSFVGAPGLPSHQQGQSQATGSQISQPFGCPPTTRSTVAPTPNTHTNFGFASGNSPIPGFVPASSQYTLQASTPPGAPYSSAPGVTASVHFVKGNTVGEELINAHGNGFGTPHNPPTFGQGTPFNGSASGNLGHSQFGIPSPAHVFGGNARNNLSSGYREVFSPAFVASAHVNDNPFAYQPSSSVGTTIHSDPAARRKLKPKGRLGRS